MPERQNTFTDGTGLMRHNNADSPVARSTEPEPEDSLLKKTVKQARKHGPKLVDYLNYLEYLRYHSPLKFDRVMQELMVEDRKVWVALQQKSPAFRPLRDTLVGGKADYKFIGLAIDALRGNLTGGTAKVFETSLQEMMKRDKFGPYAEVLGPRATTLPAPKPTYYSNSTLGQHLKAEDLRHAKAAKDAAKGLAASQEALRAARSRAIVSPMGTLIDLGVGMLDPEQGRASTNFLMRLRLDKLARINPAIDLDTANYEHARHLLSQGHYGELDHFLTPFE